MIHVHVVAEKNIKTVMVNKLHAEKIGFYADFPSL